MSTGRERGKRPAAVLLIVFAAFVILDFVAVRTRLLPARPEWVWPLAMLPLAALLLAARARATRLVVAALGALAVAGLLHQMLTFIRAWRLE